MTLVLYLYLYINCYNNKLYQCFYLNGIQGNIFHILNNKQSYLLHNFSTIINFTSAFYIFYPEIQVISAIYSVSVQLLHILVGKRNDLSKFGIIKIYFLQFPTSLLIYRLRYFRN